MLVWLRQLGCGTAGNLPGKRARGGTGGTVWMLLLLLLPGVGAWRWGVIGEAGPSLREKLPPILIAQMCMHVF